VLGALNLAAYFGDRRQMMVSMSEHADFNNDAIAARCTERFDFICHDPGNATSVAKDRKAGAVVALKMAAS
jgi:hypothetical protein